MDKTLQLIVVAALIMMAAAIILFLVTDQSGGYGDIIGNKTGGATCTTLKTQYANACDCNADSYNQETQRALQFESEASSKDCDWAGSYTCLDNVC